ncbi:MAG: hypothetical protein KBG82_06320 [Spirochaetes bacterium]|nr:hypothetical protein [Spirochaetota bacterium]MBP8991576.1 hypothetical protein [Spirochaetota bacterium]HQM89008.1 hypothetical protein [Exilispira sp.]HQQ19506.1 hypothetical protein [Exilispira sp.]
MNEIIFVLVFSILLMIIIYFIGFKIGKNSKIDKTKLKNDKLRICPLCGSRLTKDNDCVVGEYLIVNGKKKVYIYGCNYCYKGNKTSKRIDL